VAIEQAPRHTDVRAISSPVSRLSFNRFGVSSPPSTASLAHSLAQQVFFLLKESELTPSGANLLDGRYSVFGYVTQNVDALGEMKVGDVVVSAKVSPPPSHLALGDAKSSKG
jgi:cyclophilin family peptidyl-prolyl cis-trans isomerase